MLFLFAGLSLRISRRIDPETTTSSTDALFVVVEPTVCEMLIETIRLKRTINHLCKKIIIGFHIVEPSINWNSRTHLAFVCLIIRCSYYIKKKIVEKKYTNSQRQYSIHKNKGNKYSCNVTRITLSAERL
jgi:hypothetical protein